MSTSRLRITPPASSEPIPVDDAVEQAREQFKAARNAYIDMLEMFGQRRLRSLLKSEEKVTVPSLRATRDAAQRVAEQALAVVSALDACVDTCERADTALRKRTP